MAAITLDSRISTQFLAIVSNKVLDYRYDCSNNIIVGL